MAVLPRRRLDEHGPGLEVSALGAGTPTVVFVNGLGTQLEEWALVAPEIARRCLVVCFDRRPAPTHGRIRPHTTTEMAADMSAMLAALDAPAPYVLVGHSWGGVIARRFAADHRPDIAGMVYVDSAHEQLKGQVPGRVGSTLYALMWLGMRSSLVRERMLRMLGFDRLAPAERAVLAGMRWPEVGRTARAELAGIGPSCQDLAATAPALPDVPTRILLAGGRPGRMTKMMAKTFARIRALWDDAASRLSDARVAVVPDVGHYISLEDPRAVINAIDSVLDVIEGVTTPEEVARS